MEDLNISANTLGYEDALCLSQLDWHLVRLNICGSLKHLRADKLFPIVRQMAMGDWPKLNALDISNNGLSLPSMAELIRGEWPQLQMLDLRRGTFSLEDVVAVLQSPLRMLKALGALYISSEVIAPVQARPEAGNWSERAVLELKVRADLQVLQSLSAGHWPVRTLELTGSTAVYGSYTKLSLDQSRVLTGWDLGNVQDLSLSKLCISAPEVVLKLAEGNWPVLQR